MGTNWEPAIQKLNLFANATVEILNCIELENRFVAYGGKGQSMEKHSSWKVPRKTKYLNKTSCEYENEYNYKNLLDMAQQKSKHKQLLAVVEFEDDITKLNP